MWFDIDLDLKLKLFYNQMGEHSIQKMFSWNLRHETSNLLKKRN